ncbi:hypothetical protein ACWCWD_26935 [Streptomyces sp. NPDC001493]
MAKRAAWLRALGQVIDRSGDTSPVGCPDCGHHRLAVRYLVDPDSRTGYALFWCDSCLHGILVSRVRAPDGFPTWPLDDPASLDGVPEFTRRDS